MATIELRCNADGATGYRAKVRLKRFPTESATFERKTDAKEWDQQIEASMRQGRHFKTAEAKKHTLDDLINRYLREIKKKNPKCFLDVKGLLEWGKGEIGAYLFSDMSRALITEQRHKLLNTKGRNVERRSNSTVNRYMSARENALTIAANEWKWLCEGSLL